MGRISKTDKNNQPLWNDIEKLWLDLYNGTKNDPCLGIRKKVTDTDEWLAEAYIKTDYSKLTDDDFKKTLQSFFAYLVGNGFNFYKNINSIKKNKTEIKLDIENWREFKISNLFDVFLSKGDIKEGDCSKGDISLVSSGSINNGIVEYIDKDGNGIAEIFKKDKITVDMFGQAFYQPNDFYSVSHGRVNILSCKAPKFNKYIALFVCSVINSEKFRFSYNRAVYSGVISDLIIKLPSKEIRNKDNNVVKYEPDWQFMENYIKSLPYADLI